MVLFCNVTAGIGILEQASPMIQDFFRSNGGVSTVTVAAAGGFVGMLSLANMGGRFIWSSTSDYIGRKPIYMIYLGVGILAYLVLATFGHNATWLFVLLAMLIISFYGGGFSTVPAYLRDLFGTFQVGAIHGRLLTAWSAAGIAGPLIINGFLDAKGTPGKLTVDAYRPALLHDDRHPGRRLHRQPADPAGRLPLLGAGGRRGARGAAAKAPLRPRGRQSDDDPGTAHPSAGRWSASRCSTGCGRPSPRRRTSSSPPPRDGRRRPAAAGTARPSCRGPVPSRPCGFWSSAAVPASTRCAWRSRPTRR